VTSDETPSFTVDRRTVMQSGLAAGAGGLALGGPVTADSDDEHYVVASDFHWGSPFASESKSVQFLEEEVPVLDPDVLVLAGDIYEMWWRGMTSSALDIGRGSARIEEIHESGTDVVLVAGNHDRWLLRVGQDASDQIAPGEPWEIGEEFYFESGGTEYVAVHGDEGDNIIRDPLSEWLCQQTDAFGTFLLELYEFISDIGILGEVGSTTVRGGGWQSASLAHQYDDPVVVPGPLATHGLVRPRVRTKSGPAGAGSFGLRLDAWGDASPTAETVDYLAFERGHHVFGTDTTATVDRVTADGEWQPVTFAAPFAEPPAVFAAVQGRDSPESPDSGPADARRAEADRRARPGADGERLDADARVRSEDPSDAAGGPVAVQVRNVTGMGFELRLAAESEALAHDVGFVAIERGTATLGDGLVEVGVPGTTQGGSLSVEFDSPLDTADQVLAGPQTATGGPALTRHSGLSDGETSVSVVAGDGTPAAETVGYLAARDVGPIVASSSTAVESDPDTVLQQEWEALLASDHVVSPDDQPPESPTAGLLDPRYVGQQSTRSTLLDMFEEFVVFGHTHRPELGDRYVNSGSWTARSPSSVPQNTYVEIDPDEITVWNWSPEGSEKLYQS
jgi:UDP-2,3-diacylglucosamine pyrophosphatase LpxH